MDKSGVTPTFVGDLPEQCAALNRTNINVQLLTIEAAKTLKKDYIYQAALMDPHLQSELSIDDLPPLVSFAPESLSPACRGMDVQIKVQTNGHARVRTMVQTEDLRQFQQLSLFG